MTPRTFNAYWFFFPVKFNLTTDTAIVEHDRWQYQYFTWLLVFLTYIGIPIIRRTKSSPTGYIYAFQSLHIYDTSVKPDEFQDVMHIINRNNNIT